MASALIKLIWKDLKRQQLRPSNNVYKDKNKHDASSDYELTFLQKLIFSQKISEHTQNINT